jgi:tRNA (guanine37-N1)-methyltransferase
MNSESPLRFDVVTLFPDFFASPLQSGLLGKAIDRGIASVNLVNPRDFTTDKHHKVDDEPYGGGVGMLMKPEPIFAAVESLPVHASAGGHFADPPGRNHDSAVISAAQYGARPNCVDLRSL